MTSSAAHCSSPDDPHYEPLGEVLGKEQRRTKLIPHAFGERSLLELGYASLIRASQSWDRVAIKELEPRQSDDSKAEIDDDFKRRTEAISRASSRQRFSSKAKA